MSDDNVKQETPYSLTVVARLIEAFHNDFDITAACRYARCTRQSYYAWLIKYPDFAEKMDEAQSQLNLKASEVMAKAIAEGDVSTAKWYKERRDPRYKQKNVVEMPEGQMKTEEKLKEFMDDTNDGAYTDPADDIGEQPTTTPDTASGTEVAPSPPDIS